MTHRCKSATTVIEETLCHFKMRQSSFSEESIEITPIEFEKQGWQAAPINLLPDTKTISFFLYAAIQAFKKTG